MFWSQKRIYWLIPHRPESCSPSGQPNFASTQQVFSKKNNRLVDLLSLVRR
jgi:hypothetical protein